MLEDYLGQTERYPSPRVEIHNLNIHLYLILQQGAPSLSVRRTGLFAFVADERPSGSSGEKTSSLAFRPLRLASSYIPAGVAAFHRHINWIQHQGVCLAVLK